MASGCGRLRVMMGSSTPKQSEQNLSDNIDWLTKVNAILFNDTSFRTIQGDDLRSETDTLLLCACSKKLPELDLSFRKSSQSVSQHIHAPLVLFQHLLQPLM